MKKLDAFKDMASVFHYSNECAWVCMHVLARTSSANPLGPLSCRLPKWAAVKGDFTSLVSWIQSVLVRLRTWNLWKPLAFGSLQRWSQNLRDVGAGTFASLRSEAEADELERLQTWNLSLFATSSCNVMVPTPELTTPPTVVPRRRQGVSKMLNKSI